jgi:general secretion pathway protein A
MYHEYFGISEDPFSITPDTRYLYFSERHRNAFAHLLYGVAEGGGFVQLTGEVGTGKTLLCRNLLAQLPNEVNIALIFNPRLTPLELVASICDELKVLYPLGCRSVKEIVDFLNAFLLESHRQGRRTVVIIDEAQSLSFAALEQVRLLTNLETEKQKLLQIILVGQPELRRVLAKPELRQLAQRVTARYHLTPLSAQESRAYVLHRLKVAGVDEDLFTPGALRLLYRHTHGVPRLINVHCNRALLAAYGADKRKITRSTVHKVAHELLGEDEERSPVATRVWAGLTAGIALLVLVFAWQSGQLQAWLDGAVPSVVSAEPISSATKTPSSEAMVVKQDQDLKQLELTETTAVGNMIPATTAPFQTETNEVTALAQTPMEREVDAPEKAGVDSDNSLSLMGLLGDQNNAFNTLFAYWQSVYPMQDETLSACERAEQVGLSCIYGRGGWENLAYYNRPAVIELLLDDGHRYHVVVVALDDRRVTLDLAARRLTFSRAEIQSLWTGSYIVLWRPPALSADSLSMGDQGRDVAWLISMLDRIEGVQTNYQPDKASFDRALKERVIRFQQSQGLLADGIVGRKTIIQLSSRVDDATLPVLRRNEG